MTINLPDEVYSPQNLKTLILEIRNYSSWYEKDKIKQKVSGSNISEQFILSDSAYSILDSATKENKLSEEFLKSLLEELEKLESSLPKMTITLAAAPSLSLKKSLVNWCRKNIKENILVDFRFNATLLGGMVVRYNSHIYDWSFKRQIMANRNLFPEVLRRV